MTYLRLFAFGCFLATLIILTGCGSVTEVPQVSPDAAMSKGEVSPDVSGPKADGQAATSTDSAVDAGEVSTSQPQGQDGGDAQATSSEVSPVCPVGLSCDVVSKACRDLCPTCTTFQDGRCISDGYCVCR